MNFNQKVMEIKKGGNFRILGRQLFDGETPKFTWSNSGIELCARCDRFTVHFAEYHADQPAYFIIYVDGSEYKFGIYDKANKAVVENLQDKKHYIRIVKISEGSTAAVIESVEAFGKSPDFFTIPERKRIKLEFIGDSITCGFGDMASQSQNVYHTFEQDSTRTYAAITADALDAEIRTECISGQGIVHSCGTEVGVTLTNFFEFIGRDVKGYTCDGWIPDVFIINGGTNDKRESVSSEQFENGVTELLCKVRKMYPDTPIVWLYGMMMHVYDTELKNAVSRFNKTDKNTYCLIVRDIYKMKNETGAVGHPNVNGHERCAKILIKQLNKILEKGTDKR